MGVPPLVAAYLPQVTVTSARGVAQAVDLTLVAPHGAVPLANRPAVWTSPLHLGPFGTQRLLMHFYFPAPSKDAGGYGQCPASIARQGRLLAVGGVAAGNGSSGGSSSGSSGGGLVVVAEAPVAGVPEGGCDTLFSWFGSAQLHMTT